MRFTMACKAVVLETSQHRFGVRLAMALGAVRYIAMFVGMAKDALQG